MLTVVLFEGRPGRARERPIGGRRHAGVEPFTVTTESGTCPGVLCPTGSYYLIGEPGDAPPNPLLKS
jgi:hypothetical protein